MEFESAKKIFESVTLLGIPLKPAFCGVKWELIFCY
jgi:hypothetical protein